MSTSGQLSAASALGNYIAGVSYDMLPANVIREAKLRIADVVGIGLSGSRTSARNIKDFCKISSKSGTATLWGCGQKLSAPYAALANGTMIFHLELDDVHRKSHTHPGVSCIPAAIALGEEYGISGRRLIEAVTAGYDACIRIGMAVSPSIYVDRTYLAPGTLSGFGAAASAAKIIGADAVQAANILGAVSYYGPLAAYESFKLGAGIKDIIMGWGNLCGIYAADLVRAGFNGVDSSIDGEFGYCKTVSDRYDTERLYKDLGTVYEIVNTGVKPYACCRQHHSAIDCILALRERYSFGLDDVRSVVVRTFTVSSRGNNKHPDTIPAAKYSIPYIMAAALKYGKVWREQFSDELIRDNELLSFAQKVKVIADSELDQLYDEKWPSIVEVTLKNGDIISERRDLPLGEPESACSEEEIHTKFISLACDAVTEEKAEIIWKCIMNIDDCPNISAMTSLIE